MRTYGAYRWALGAALLGAVAAPGSARAQGVALDRFDPSVAGDRMFGVESAFVAGDVTPRAMLLFDYAHDPLVVRANSDGASFGAVVKRQLMMHASVSLALFHRLSLDLDVPAAIYQAGDSPTLPGSPSVVLSSPSSPQFADIRLGARLRLYGGYDDAFQLAISGRAWLPTGPSTAYVGDGSVRWMAQAVLGGKTDRIVWSFAAGPKIAVSETIGNLSQGTMIKAGAGLGVLLLRDRALQIGPEASLSLITSTVNKDTAGVEALLGARYRFLRDFEVGAAAGPGFGGAGTPDVRVVAMIAYSPPDRADRDRDGILDAVDACPDVAGVASDDATKNGCPQVLDRDHDGIPDADDACPDVAGPPNADPKKNGCPPAGDRDHDGIPDDVDACPDVAGVASADPKRNGCPLADRDHDGIPDAEDACPDVAGVRTADPKTNGCPLDTDHDGIPDALDACPNDPGPPNADPKRNGCPRAVLRGNTEIEILEQVQFDTNKSTIQPVSNALLDEVAAVMRAHPELSSFEVQGHTDSTGLAKANELLSRRRAEAVRDALVKRGIAGGRLHAKGYGQTKPIADNATDAGRTRNRRVQFIVDKK